MDALGVDTIVQHLLELGVKPGGILVVHTAFSKIKPVESGPQGLIEGLRIALGPSGTLVMPSMTSDDGYPFDPKITPCLGMGIVADTFWRQWDVLRSDSPHAFAAAGPLAARVTALHPVDVPHGLDSPVGLVYELDGQALLLGVGHDVNTTIHLAENLAGVRYRRNTYATILKNGEPKRFEYREPDHCTRNFTQVDAWLDARHLQRRGKVGHGETRLANSRDVVTVALEQLRANETVFLHLMGFDEECDEARRSLVV